jgi:hypothetical protein
VQVRVGADAEDLEDLIQEFAVLAAGDDAAIEDLGALPQLADHRQQLDGLGTCPQGDRDPELLAKFRDVHLGKPAGRKG